MADAREGCERRSRLFGTKMNFVSEIIIRVIDSLLQFLQQKVLVFVEVTAGLEKDYMLR